MLEVRTTTYGPGIDQSQHAKSVSHIIKENIRLKSVFNTDTRCSARGHRAGFYP